MSPVLRVPQILETFQSWPPCLLLPLGEPLPTPVYSSLQICLGTMTNRVVDEVELAPVTLPSPAPLPPACGQHCFRPKPCTGLP